MFAFSESVNHCYFKNLRQYSTIFSKKFINIQILKQKSVNYIKLRLFVRGFASEIFFFFFARTPLLENFIIIFA